MLENNFAEHFAADWIDSWNSHDLGRILSHYTDDFEMSSPIIITAYPLLPALDAKSRATQGSLPNTHASLPGPISKAPPGLIMA